jgi:CheY-like chemotaxis protein/MinD-like ATPase involved in chromosome partitioning or flagellar assembly
MLNCIRKNFITGKNAMPEKILIVDDDLDTLRLVGMMLQKQGYQIIAASNGQQGLDLALEEIPNLILLDVMMPQMDGYEVARNLRANPKTVDIPILMFTAKSQLDDKVTGFEAGADDYLTKPTHPAELQAHVKALLARSAKGSKINPSTSPPSEEPAHTLGVLVVRGGLGATTIALNLASSLERASKSNVILAEFRPGQGTLVGDLNLPKEKGLSELLKMQPKEVTRDIIKDKINKHQSGVKILCASGQPSEAVLVENVQGFQAILSRMKFMAQFVVVDLGCGLPSLTQKLLPAFDEILVITEPFHHPIMHTRALLDDLVKIGVDKAKIRLGVNYRLRSELQLSVPQVQDKIEFPIDVTFTPAPELMMQAIRLQNTAYLVQTDSLTNQQYTGLANKILNRTRSRNAQE